MKDEDVVIIKKMIKYWDDINILIKETNKDIPWRAIKGMRNLHAHDYENVDLEIVWNTLVEDIPALKGTLEKLLL